MTKLQQLETQYLKDGWDKVEDRDCPNCKTKTLYTACLPNGPDDYNKAEECAKCGERWDE